MHNLTIASALTGGALIGVSAVLLLWLFGRIAGISGIIHGLIPAEKGDIDWRIYFLVGLVAGSCVYHFVPSVHFHFRQHYPIALSLIGGMLVGFGTRIGSGCTSGHGVCGLSRLSIRSFAATLTFMIFGVITVYVLRHIFGVN